MHKRVSRILGALAIILIFISWVILLQKISPATIVDFFGTQNSYLLVFFLAFVGGTSILFPFPYYLVVFTFGAAHLNPILLGIFAGTGVMLGDSTSYLVGYSGREIIPAKLSERFNKIRDWLLRQKSGFIALGLFLYGAIIPIPNDVVIVPLGVIRFSYIKAVIPLWLGNIVFNIIVAFAGLYGLSFVFNL